MIVASAVRLKDGRVFIGSRHGDCYVKMEELGLEIHECNNGATQGFITDRLVFLNSELAYYNELEYGQCVMKTKPEFVYIKGTETENWKPILSSEDLW